MNIAEAFYQLRQATVPLGGGKLVEPIDTVHAAMESLKSANVALEAEIVRLKGELEKAHALNRDIDRARRILQDERNALLKELEELRMATLKCAHCGKPATCFGRYEDQSGPLEFACNECCGHGNEDGWCKRIRELPEEINRLWGFYEACLKTEGLHDHSVILQILRQELRSFKAKHKE